MRFSCGLYSKISGRGYIKLFIALILPLFIVIAAHINVEATAATATANPAPAVIEAQHVRVVINGVYGNYTDTTLEINGRILLPFRELLTKLGVPNDNDHIIWNEEEETVTVIDGGNTIRLRIGDPVMSVNGIAKTFDVAPFFYSVNNRTYIPVRAVSELMDKYIMWEETTSTVFIRDTNNYAETLALLEKIRDTEKPSKVRASVDNLLNFQITTNGPPLPGADEDGVMRATIELSQLIMSDVDKNTYHIKQLYKLDGINIGSEVCKYGDRLFMKIEGPGYEWTEVTDQGVDIDAVIGQIELLEGQLDSRPLTDTAMGLAAIRGPDGTYSIVGEPPSVTDINSILNAVSDILQFDEQTVFDMKINKYQVGAMIDRECNLIKAVVTIGMDFSITRKTAGGNFVTLYFKCDTYMTINYDRVTPEFTVTVPDGVAKLL